MFNFNGGGRTMKNIIKRRALTCFALLFALVAVSVIAPGSAFAVDVFSGNPIADIARESSPAVVNIDVEAMVTRSIAPFPDDPFFRKFFGEEFERFKRSVPMKGRGSGFIVSDDGEIITNSHVIENADRIEVTLSDGRKFEAEVLGKDPTFDLAVLKIKADKLPVLELGDSDKLQVGEWVVAIGNPFGLEHTVTAGVVSAKNRSIHAGNVNFEGFLQTDAAINPGNSGGPLIDLEGKVVGINSAIIPYAQGIGFAIPVNMAKDIMEDLVKYGKVRRGWLGVYVQPLTAEFREAYGLSFEKGAVISDVVKGSPADEAGLERGDVIRTVNGREIEDHRQLVFVIRQSLAGDKVKIGIFRNGKEMKIDVVLGEVEEASSEEATGGRTSLSSVGIALSPVNEDLKRKYDLETDSGAVVTEVTPGSPADRAGIKTGDVILEINGRKLLRPGDYRKLDLEGAKSAVMLVLRDQRTFFVSMSLR
jgi:serine protease Do